MDTTLYHVLYGHNTVSSVIWTQHCIICYMDTTLHHVLYGHYTVSTVIWTLHYAMGQRHCIMPWVICVSVMYHMWMEGKQKVKKAHTPTGDNIVTNKMTT